MKNAKLNWVRLPIDSLENCRELGGYNTRHGEQTKWHAFLRSSEMSKLTPEEVGFLKAYGVTTVIDLRGEDEIQKHPNPLAHEDFCEYHNKPFITLQVSDITQHVADVARSLENVFMGDFYVDLLERSEVIKEIMDVIGQAEEGCVLFHCQAGKDRTGILAMLLLGLAGVEKKDIVSNYETTYTNLESIHDYAGERPYGDIPESFMYSSREYILRAYEYILDKYGDFEQYMRAKGVSEEVIDRVKGRLVAQSEIVSVS